MIVINYLVGILVHFSSLFLKVPFYSHTNPCMHCLKKHQIYFGTFLIKEKFLWVFILLIISFFFHILNYKERDSNSGLKSINY